MAKKKPAAKAPAHTTSGRPPEVEPPITTAIGQDANGMWTVDISIAHGDQTVVRVNGRAVWQGTP